MFDTNDFDEGTLGPFTWDLRRMAASLVLAAQETGRNASGRDGLARIFADAYQSTIGGFKGNDTELNYRLDASNTSSVVDDLIASVGS